MSFKVGKIGEAYVASILIGAGISVEMNRKKDKMKYYDLLCSYNGVDFTCEIKFDKKFQVTGNIVIEYKNTRKNEPSGIAISKADLWFIVLCFDGKLTAWCTPLSLLKRFVSSNVPVRVVKNGGDDNSSFYLYKFSDISSILTRVDGLSNAEIANTIMELVGND